MVDMVALKRTGLPVLEMADAVNLRLAESPRLVLTAPPGAGKSTILPLTILRALEEASPAVPAKILLLEPRRIAARQIAERMAGLIGEPVGQTVGYRIRFESRVGPQTRIEVLTEGILTRMLVDDPGLEGVAAVIFDEFHERSLQSDLALALTCETQQLLRPDLRILLMSATIDAQALCAALNAPLIESAGRVFPVEIIHTEDAVPERISEAVARQVLQAHRTHEGDILAFLPGEGEIRRCTELLEGTCGDTRIFPLYGLLSSAEQRAAIVPSGPGARKIVLATPIAETSLTIEGVRVVVDGGFCRKAVFDPQNALSRLETVRISRDMADQRSGRAGRVAPGVCYRLWSLATEARMAPTRVPEILDADLAGTVLDAAAWGESRIENLPWITPPPSSHAAQARSLLELLGALRTDGPAGSGKPAERSDAGACEGVRITPHGRKLAALPCHPRIAQMLLQAQDPGQKALAADIAALLEEKDPLAGTEQGAAVSARIDALRGIRRNQKSPDRRSGRWSRILHIAEQYRGIVRVPEDNAAADPYAIGELLAHAYPERMAKARPDGRFQLANGELAFVDPQDPLSACEWLAVASLNSRRDGAGRIFLAAPANPLALTDLVRSRDRVVWDSKAGAALARRERRIGSLLVDARPLSEGIREQLTQAICAAAQKEGTAMLDFSDEVGNLQRRVAAVAAWHPELGLPDLSTDAVLARAPEWLPPFVGRATTTAELKRIDLTAALWSLLDYGQQQAVERLAPAHIAVPTGSRIRVEYRQGADAPVLRVRLQECFGLTDTPRVDDGRRPVLMDLLSPGYKSVQLTADLRSFWSGTYFEVRKELRRRYPKHAWPDDPLEAEAVRGVKRKKD